MKIKSKENLVGMIFGRWKVLERVDSRGGMSYYKCVCICGNFKEVRGSNLKDGSSKSCGCLNRELSSIRAKKIHTTHGNSSDRLWGIWFAMNNRCNNVNDGRYSDYGGRGIKVCEEWSDSYEIFRDWSIINGYSHELSIDRMNNDGNYEPSNCRWATRKQQSRNKKDNIRVIINGEDKLLIEWCEILDLNYGTIYTRIYRGWDSVEALLTPIRK